MESREMEVFKSNLQGGLPPALVSSNPQTLRVEVGAETRGSTRGAETAEGRDVGLKSPRYQVSDIPVGGSEFASECGGLARTETQGSPASASRAPSCLGLPGAAAVPSRSSSPALRGQKQGGVPAGSCVSSLPRWGQLGPEASSVAAPCSVTCLKGQLTQCPL